MIQISNKVFYIGTNDRKKHLFENNWPLPNGVADTLEYGSDPDYLSNIETALGGRDLEYLVVNHMEPDHSSMIGEILRRYPHVKVVANCKTFKILESYYPLPAENVYEIKEGDILELGYHKLTFVMVPWVHWPETMVTYDTVDQILFSCDAFGSIRPTSISTRKTCSATIPTSWASGAAWCRRHSRSWRVCLSGLSAPLTALYGARTRARCWLSTTSGASMRLRTVS